jgi:DNA invertase Pin-like site-specific DNA recombinase
MIIPTTETAALYARLSREDVDGKHAGCDSIKVQTCDGAEAIRAQEWLFNADRHVFEDDDVSGRKVRRKGWDALLAAARRREFSILVVRDLDRIARYEPARAMATLIQLRDLGVRVWCYKDRAFPPLDGIESILTYVKAIANQQYVESIRANVTAGLRKRALEGRAVKGAAFGYRVENQGANGKRWVIDPAAQEAVLRLGRAFIETRSLFGAAKKLNEEGLLTPKGCAWRPDSVRLLLLRPQYRGFFEHGAHSGGEPLVIPHPELRIWPPEMEAEIDRLLARPTKPWGRTPRRFSTRLVRCGLCGGAMISTSSKRSKRGPDGTPERSLCCDRHRVKGCPGVGYRKEHIVDAAILGAVNDLLTDEVWTRTKQIVREALEARDEADKHEAEIDRLRREVQGSVKRIRSLTDGVAEAEDAAARAPLLEALRSETKRSESLRAALARAEAAPAPGTPETILEEAERRVEALRTTLARGGPQAVAAVEAVLGEGAKFTAMRIETGAWELTARGSLANLFVESSSRRRTRPTGRSRASRASRAGRSRGSRPGSSTGSG